MRPLLDCLLVIALTFGVFIRPAGAAEFVYGPEGCDFKITFPEEPSPVRRCHEIMTDKCEMMAGYTRVFDLNATVNIYANCTPVAPTFRAEFTADAMRTALLARPGVDALELYDITYSETDEATMTALFGAGKSPNDQDVIIYMIQMWAGDNSLLTVEAELIGNNVEEADQLFTDILYSLEPKNKATPADAATADSMTTDANSAESPEGGDGAPADENTPPSPASKP